MPRLDGTGPNQQGSMTGKGMGNCVNIIDEKNQQYFCNKKFCCKIGRGRGLGRGFRNRNFQQPQNKES